MNDTRISHIYFDGNEGSDNERYGPRLERSLEDLAKIPSGPEEGMIITIYMIGEIEMKAKLEWESAWNAWSARPVEGTARKNLESWN